MSTHTTTIMFLLAAMAAGCERATPHPEPHQPMMPPGMPPMPHGPDGGMSASDVVEARGDAVADGARSGGAR